MERFRNKYFLGVHDLIVKIHKIKTYSSREIELLHWRFTEYLDNYNESEDNLNEVLECFCKYILIVLKYSENENFESNSEFKSNIIQYMSVLGDIGSTSQLANGFIEAKTSIIFEHVTDPSIKITFAKALLRSYNQVIKYTDKLLRAKLIDSDCTINLYKLADILCACGDYEYQTYLLETIFRLCSSDFIEEHAVDFFPETESLQHAFLKINIKEFDCTLRIFLNTVNRVHTNVYSFNVNDIFVDEVQVSPPMIGQDKKELLWVDFNMGSKTIGIYCDQVCLRSDPLSQDREDTGWELITIFANDVSLVEVKKPKSMKEDENKPTLFRFTLINPLHVQYPGSESITTSKLLRIVILDNEVVEKLQSSVLPNMFNEKFKGYQSRKNKSKTNDSSSMEIEYTRGTYKPLTVRCVTRSKKSRSIKSMDTRSMKSLEELLNVTKPETSDSNKNIVIGISSPDSTILDTSLLPETQYFSAEEDLNDHEQSLIDIDDDESDTVDQSTRNKIKTKLHFIRQGVSAKKAFFEPLFSPILETSEINRSEQSSYLQKNDNEATAESNNDYTNENETQYFSPDIISTQATTAEGSDLNTKSKRSQEKKVKKDTSKPDQNVQDENETQYFSLDIISTQATTAKSSDLNTKSKRSQEKKVKEDTSKPDHNVQENDEYNQFCTDVLNDIDKGIDSEKWYPPKLMERADSEVLANFRSNADLNEMGADEVGFRGFIESHQDRVNILDEERLSKSQESQSRRKRYRKSRDKERIIVDTNKINITNCQESKLSANRKNKVETLQSPVSKSVTQKENEEKIIVLRSQESIIRDEYNERITKNKAKTPRSPFLKSATQELNDDAITMSSSQRSTLRDDISKDEYKERSKKSQVKTPHSPFLKSSAQESNGDEITISSQKDTISEVVKDEHKGISTKKIRRNRKNSQKTYNSGENNQRREIVISASHTQECVNSEMRYEEVIQNNTKTHTKSTATSADSSLIRLPTPSVVVIDLTHLKESTSSYTEAITESDLKENSGRKTDEDSLAKIRANLETEIREELVESDNDSTWVDENLLGNTSSNVDSNAGDDNLEEKDEEREDDVQENISNHIVYEKASVGETDVENAKENYVVVDLTSTSDVEKEENDGDTRNFSNGTTNDVLETAHYDSDVSSAIIGGTRILSVKQRLRNYKHQKSQTSVHGNDTKNGNNNLNNLNEVELESSQHRVKDNLANDKELEKTLIGDANYEYNERHSVVEEIMDNKIIQSNEDLKSIASSENEGVDEFIVAQSKRFDEIFSQGATKQEKDNRNSVKESCRQKTVENYSSETSTKSQRKLRSLRKKPDDDPCLESVDSANDSGKNFNDLNEEELENNQQHAEDVPEQEKLVEILGHVETNMAYNDNHSDTLFSEISRTSRNTEIIEPKNFQVSKQQENRNKGFGKIEESQRNVREKNLHTSSKKNLQNERLKIAGEKGNELCEKELVPVKKRSVKKKIIETEQDVSAIKSLRNEKFKVSKEVTDEVSEEEDDDDVPLKMLIEKKKVIDSEEDASPVKCRQNEKSKVAKEGRGEMSEGELVPVRKLTGNRKFVDSDEDVSLIKSWQNKKSIVSKKGRDEMSEKELAPAKRATGKKKVVDSEQNISSIKSAINEETTSDEEKDDAYDEEFLLPARRGAKIQIADTQKDDTGPVRRNLRNRTFDTSTAGGNEKSKEEVALPRERGRKKKTVTAQEDNISCSDENEDLGVQKLESSKEDEVAKPEIEPVLSKKRGRKVKPLANQDNISNEDKEVIKSQVIVVSPDEDKSGKLTGKGLQTMQEPKNEVFDGPDNQNKKSDPIKDTPSEETTNNEIARTVYDINTEILISSQKSKSSDGKRKLSRSDTTLFEKSARTKRRLLYDPNDLTYLETNFTIDEFNNTNQLRNTVAGHKDQLKRKGKDNLSKDMNKSKAGRKKSLPGVKTHSTIRHRRKSTQKEKENDLNIANKTSPIRSVEGEEGVEDKNNIVIKKTKAKQKENDLNIANTTSPIRSVEGDEGVEDKNNIVIKKTKAIEKEQKELQFSENSPDAEVPARTDLDKITTIEEQQEAIRDETEEVTKVAIKKVRKPAARKKESNKKMKSINNKSESKAAIKMKALDDYFTEFTKNYIFTEEERQQKEAFDYYFGDLTNNTTRDRERRSSKKRKRTHDPKTDMKENVPKVKILENIVLKPAHPTLLESKFDSLMKEHFNETTSKMKTSKDDTTERNELENIGEPLASSSMCVPPPIRRLLKPNPFPFKHELFNDLQAAYNPERLWSEVAKKVQDLCSLLVQTVPPTIEKTEIHQVFLEFVTKLSNVNKQ